MHCSKELSCLISFLLLFSVIVVSSTILFLLFVSIFSSSILTSDSPLLFILISLLKFFFKSISGMFSVNLFFFIGSSSFCIVSSPFCIFSLSIIDLFSTVSCIKSSFNSFLSIFCSFSLL